MVSKINFIPQDEDNDPEKSKGDQIVVLAGPYNPSHPDPFEMLCCASRCMVSLNASKRTFSRPPDLSTTVQTVDKMSSRFVHSFYHFAVLGNGCKILEDLMFTTVGIQYRTVHAESSFGRE